MTGSDLNQVGGRGAAPSGNAHAKVPVIAKAVHGRRRAGASAKHPQGAAAAKAQRIRPVASHCGQAAQRDSGEELAVLALEEQRRPSITHPAVKGRSAARLRVARAPSSPSSLVSPSCEAAQSGGATQAESVCSLRKSESAWVAAARPFYRRLQEAKSIRGGERAVWVNSGCPHELAIVGSLKLSTPLSAGGRLPPSLRSKQGAARV